MLFRTESATASPTISSTTKPRLQAATEAKPSTPIPTTTTEDYDYEKATNGVSLSGFASTF